MRQITIPPNIPSADLTGVGNDEFSFEGFVVSYAVPNMPRKSVAELKALSDLAAKFSGAKPGDVVELTVKEHALLQASLPNIQGTLFLRMIAFYTAVAGATEKPADKEKTDD